MSDAPLAACPHCGGEVRKLISAPSFQFKGSGFYKTDYADKKSGGSGSPPGKSESKPEKAETNSESKSESKAESSSSESKATVAKPEK
jgi:predicted nucleic acid-binding Zn ribbon protein